MFPVARYQKLLNTKPGVKIDEQAKCFIISELDKIARVDLFYNNTGKVADFDMFMLIYAKAYNNKQANLKCKVPLT